MGTVDIDRRMLIRQLERTIEELETTRNAAGNFLEHRIKAEIQHLRSMKDSSDVHDREWLEQGINRLLAEAHNLDDLLQHMASYLLAIRDDTETEKNFAHDAML